MLIWAFCIEHAAATAINDSAQMLSSCYSGATLAEWRCGLVRKIKKNGSTVLNGGAMSFFTFRFRLELALALGLARVVDRFFCDGDVVGVALIETACGDAHKACVCTELIEV